MIPFQMQFQLTHSRGVRPLHTITRRTILQISTHALTWSATSGLFQSDGACSDFNSRTHVECDDMEGIQLQDVAISTHALTWSAT